MYSAYGKNFIAIYFISVFVYGKASVCIAIEGQANVCANLFNIFLKTFYMR
ncbi:hypothetical protein SDC9_170465 [bioreactor metagenome]|uniref:Uncharacterized protein n=1 Tax=bioreactor metagenome TaxID=1076179 RepID=A0A645GAL5_9ZZZZ